MGSLSSSGSSTVSGTLTVSSLIASGTSTVSGTLNVANTYGQVTLESINNGSYSGDSWPGTSYVTGVAGSYINSYWTPYYNLQYMDFVANTPTISGSQSFIRFLTKSTGDSELRVEMQVGGDSVTVSNQLSAGTVSTSAVSTSEVDVNNSGASTVVAGDYYSITSTSYIGYTSFDAYGDFNINNAVDSDQTIVIGPPSYFGTTYTGSNSSEQIVEIGVVSATTYNTLFDVMNANGSVFRVDTDNSLVGILIFFDSCPNQWPDCQRPCRNWDQLARHSSGCEWHDDSPWRGSHTTRRRHLNGQFCGRQFTLSKDTPCKLIRL